MRFSLERNADAYIKTTEGFRTPSTWRNNTTDSRRIEHLHEWKIEKQQVRGTSGMSYDKQAQRMKKIVPWNYVHT